MAKKKAASTPRVVEEKPATLKDLLDPAVLQKLKAQAAEMKAEEEDRKEAERKQKEEARLTEQKRLDNDFAHLLENSSLDWKSYK